MEKPFGQDLTSAIELNNDVRRTFQGGTFTGLTTTGQEMAQNIMVIWFANTLFEPQWNNRYIDHIQLSLTETVGVGADRTMSRQVLSGHSAESYAAAFGLDRHGTACRAGHKSIRDEKVKVLRSHK